MKITIEIKEDKFIFDYEVGPVCKHHSEGPLNTGSLILFASLIDHCHKIYMHDCANKGEVRK